MNTLLFFIAAITVFSLLLICYRLFGKTGLYCWVVVAMLTANILVCKCVDLFGFSATLGNIMFGSIFLTTDILTECYDVRSARAAVNIGFIFGLVGIIVFQLGLLFVPNSLDTVDVGMHLIFDLFPRVTISSMLLFLISNYLDIFLFTKIKQYTGDKYLFIRNNVATMISQCCENLAFYVLAFGGIYSFKDLLSMTFICCVIEVIVALCDTPFLYIATKINGQLKD